VDLVQTIHAIIASGMGWGCSTNGASRKVYGILTKNPLGNEPVIRKKIKITM